MGLVDDLDKRGLTISAFICETKEGLLQVISYDSDENVQFISEPIKELTLSERLKGNVIRPIATILKKAEPESPKEE